MVFDGTLLVIGAGKMGGAILSAWLEGKDDAFRIAPDQIVVEDPSPPPEIVDLLKKYDIKSAAHVELRCPPSMVLLGVKPQMIDDVLVKTPPRLDENSLIFSIAAGKTLDDLARYLPDGTPIVRAMVNMPVLVQAGMTVMIANSQVTDYQKDLINELARNMGEFVWIKDEGLMDTVTAVSGSGPAYVFYLAECLAKAGMRQGLDADLAMRLAEATVSGAGVLLQHSDLAAKQLRENVTSPQGTTAAALDVLMDDGVLEGLIETAVAAAKKRSGALSG